MSIIPPKLQEMCDFLRDNPVVLVNEHRDGRVNSSLHEDQIIEHLRKNGFGVEYFRSSDDLGISNRCWWDIVIEEGDKVYPVNIKTSSHKTSDNACNFLALNWALTDIDISFYATPNAGRDTRKFMEWYNGDQNSEDRDYYFLSVNKNNTSEVIANSLKCIPEATPNPNNLPFQVCWRKNHNTIKRTNKEALEYYMNILRQSFDKDWRLSLAKFLSPA